MKHVLLLMPTHWSALLGGAEYQAKLLLEHLVRTGRYRITWACRRVADGHRPDGYEIRRIARHDGFRRRGFFLDHFRLGRLLEELRPDAIYQRVGCAYTGIAARYAMRSGCRMLWHVASDIDVTPIRDWRLRDTLLPFRRLEKMALEYGARHAPQIVVQTRQQASLLRKHYGREPAALVGNFHPPASETIDKSGPQTVLWIGNLKPVKNPLAFVDLACAFRDRPDIRFIMVGDPAGDPGCAALIAARSAEIPGFRFVGRQTQDEVNALLAHAHLLVNTSRYEGLSNTFIQAWQRQAPVASLNVDPDGLLGHEGMGFCAGGDASALASGVRALLDDETRRELTGRGAQAYAAAHHSEHNVDTLLRLLEG